MNITTTHVGAALALLVIGYTLGRRQATKPAATVANDTTADPAQWWSYAGSWGG